MTPQSPPAGDWIEKFHPTHCDKYTVLRGIYPNDRRETDKPCSCGFEAALNAYILAQVKELETPAYPETMEYVAMVKKAQENGKYDDMYENGWKAAIAAAQARFGAGEVAEQGVLNPKGEA